MMETITYEVWLKIFVVPYIKLLIIAARFAESINLIAEVVLRR